MGIVLPPAVERARDLLDQFGSMEITALQDALRSGGLVLREPLLRSLPERYPGHFALDVDGRLSLARRTRSIEVADSAPGDGAEALVSTWATVKPVERTTFDRVVVFDLETTGLDASTDEVWELAAVRLDGSAELHLRVAVSEGLQDRVPVPAGEDRPLPFAVALAKFARFCDGATAIAGQNVRGFDVPFLANQVEREGLEWERPFEVIDLLDLAVLVWPTMAERTLTSLCSHVGVELTEAHRAIHDTRATAAVFRAAVATVDPEDSGWRLALSCLDRGGHPLASILPLPASPRSLAEHLVPRPDPLVELVRSPGSANAHGATRSGFERLSSTAGYRERPSQREMAGRVAGALDNGSHLMVEAPTGTGKSLAYLIPAIGRARNSTTPVIVATATRALQDQLRIDAQRLADLGVLDVPYRQIMGVNNYLCTREIAQMLEGGADGPDQWLATAVATRALGSAPNGVWDDINDGHLIRGSRAYAHGRMLMRTTSAECERDQCEWRHACPMLERLRGLREWPGIVATNHAMVAGWVRATAGGGVAPGKLLAPGVSSLIFDEAHQLEDSLTQAWTGRVDAAEFQILLATLRSRRGPLRLAQACLRAMTTSLRSEGEPLVTEIRSYLAQLERDVDRLGECVTTYVHEYGGTSRAATLVAGLSSKRPEQIAVRAALQDTRRAAVGVRRAFQELLALLDRAKGDVPLAEPRAPFRVRGATERLDELIDLLQAFEHLVDSHVWVYRLTADLPEEDAEADWVFERMPVDVGPFFADLVVAPSRSVVLTSATLTVEKSFEFVASRLGVSVTADGSGHVFDVVRLSSPFDYRKQSMVVLTNHLPVPVPSNERAFIEDVAADQVGLLSLTGGRMLTLFAARRRMMAVAERVRLSEAALAERGVELIVQGERSRNDTARRFISNPGTVLYGTRSYWEGFDAPGETLSYLVIEKPPYPHPNDPLVTARQKAILERGGDPFTEYILPLTAMQLSQGFGRLIRSEDDRGVALMLDRRLHSPGIAREVLLGSLPDPQLHEALDRDDAWTTAIQFVTGAVPDLATALTVPLDDVAQALLDLRLLPGEEPTWKLREAARRIFGVEQLHDAQLALMKAFLSGDDCIGVLPTGFGKSICFQLPALLHPTDRATVVVSPLVALIKDQVDDLRGQRGLRPVQGITGSTSLVVQTEILRDLAEGRVRLLYVSPERLVRNPPLQGALARQDLNGLVVDEAHCVSVWGHDFRPEFRQIPKAVAGLKRTPRMALTATATGRVETDIAASLELDRPVVVREPADRPNLRLRVQRCDTERERARELLRIAMAMGDAPGIVYASRRATTEELAALLRRAGFRARHYHAGMVPEQRESVQEDFRADMTQIIVATKAFGMGINKPDIGWVLHFDLPDSLDGYAQEAGRAARKPEITGECVLLYTVRDIARRRRQARPRAVQQELLVARGFLAALRDCRVRGGDVVFNSVEMAEQLGVEEDLLNLVVARLEEAGCIRRQLDTSARGVVAMSLREPRDPDECERFRQLLRIVLKCVPLKRSLVDFDQVADERGLDPDRLEADLIGWSLDRLITFSTSQRYWRVTPLDLTFPETAYRKLVLDWSDWSRDRLQALISYVDGHECRRATIARHFGDRPRSCLDSGWTRCDRCADDDPFWLSVPIADVPDPESLVNVVLVTLQAVAWATSYTTGRYGERGLLAALHGRESLGEGRPISAGLLGCPQFGALRHIHGAQRRLEEAVSELLASGLISRADATHLGRSYSTLRVTDEGLAYLRRGRG